MSVDLTTQRARPLLRIENSLKHAYESQKFVPPYLNEKNTNTAKQRRSQIPGERTCFQLPVGVRRPAVLISALR